MLLLIAPEKWQEQLRLAAPVRVMKVAVIEDDEPLDENDIRSRLVQRKGVGGNSPDKEKPREVIPLVGGEWLTHKLTPFDKNFKSPTDSPVRTPAPSIQSSALHTPAHSEFDVADLFSNPTTRANSHTNSPRLMSSDKDSMGGGITESEKMKIVSDKLRSKGAYDAIQAARKKSLRPEKPSFAMDEATKQMLQAMLMTEDPTSISMTVPTYDLINKRLAAPQQVKHGIGSVIIEGDDDEEGDDLSTGDKASSWLFRSADVGETPVNPDSLQSSGIAFKSR